MTCAPGPPAAAGLDEREAYMSALDGLAKGHACVVAAADPAVLRRPRPAAEPRRDGPAPATAVRGGEEEAGEGDGEEGGQALRMLEELLAVGWGPNERRRGWGVGGLVPQRQGSTSAEAE